MEYCSLAIRISNNIHESPKCYVGWKKTDTKQYTVFVYSHKVQEKAKTIHGDGGQKKVVYAGGNWLEGT